MESSAKQNEVRQENNRETVWGYYACISVNVLWHCKVFVCGVSLCCVWCAGGGRHIPESFARD